MKRRSLEIDINRAGRYFRRLILFLSPDGINQRLSKIDKQIQSASGIYLKNWVIPRAAWWLGLKEARAIIQRNDSFRGATSILMERPLQTAVKLSILHNTFTASKSIEFRSRILADDILEPTLFEIDTASHFWQLGYDIEWFENRSDSGERTPEFIAKRNDHEIEVECKSKQADSGRRIERATFYRLVDLIFPIIEKKGLSGIIFLEVPARLPRQTEWFLEVQQAVEDRFESGSGSVVLSGDEQFIFDLHIADGSVVHLRELASMVDPVSNTYSHFAFMGQRRNDLISNPIVFRLDSKKRDAFLDNVMESLRNAQQQFTGNRSALISCLIPEIDSFEGLQSDSAIVRMTNHYFEEYSKDFINTVSYVSEMNRVEEGGVIISDMPSLTFRNHKYNEKFGPDIPISQ
ncbi:hypothetical protein ACFLV7_03625 [Chloroflexota bacterium]